jgi:hypothetical protein
VPAPNASKATTETATSEVTNKAISEANADTNEETTSEPDAEKASAPACALDRSGVKPLDAEESAAANEGEATDLSLSEDEIMRHSALLLTLCRYEPGLFDEVIRVYVHGTRLGLSPSSSATVQLNAQAVREAVHRTLPELVPCMPIEFLAQRLIPNCPRGGEPLLLRLVHLAIDHTVAEYNHYLSLVAEHNLLKQQHQLALQQLKQQLGGFQKPAPPAPPTLEEFCERKSPPDAIVEAVRQRALRTADSRFLLPILPYLSKVGGGVALVFLVCVCVCVCVWYPLVVVAWCYCLRPVCVCVCVCVCCGV